MASSESLGKDKSPQDLGEYHVRSCYSGLSADGALLVAIFHASFHPTKGNVIDWSLTASDSERSNSRSYDFAHSASALNLRNLEFTALPSGLHLLEQDVVYVPLDRQKECL
jgi:hypothetical protein